MEANGVGMNTADHGTNNLQSRPSGSLRRSNSSSSAIGRHSCSFPSRFHTSLNEGAVNGNFSQVQHVLDQVSEDHGHHSSFTIPISVGTSTENGAFPSRFIRNGSLGQASSNGASLRRLFSLSGAYHPQLDEEVESRVVSEAGDSGDRALSRRGSRECPQFFLDEGDVYHIPDFLLKAYGFLPHVPSNPTALPPIPHLASETTSPETTNAVLEDKHVRNAALHDKHEDKKELPPSLEYIACLVHLAVFGILGVLTRSVLQKLFGPGVANVTSDQSILYLDLPSNMIGSFLMGWFGVVFKADISRMSDQLAIGLSTGYLGSLTTFSGWNQKMLDLSIHGHWVFALLGFVIGLFLAAYSIIIGVETAKGFRWILRRTGRGLSSSERLNNTKLHLIVLLVLILIWSGLWVTSGILEKKDFEIGGRTAQLWLACLVGPFGVWIRWWLARLNGRGIGKTGRCKWIPFGTLIANVSAACLMAALATTKKAVKTKNCDTVATGIQFGLLGCLSTVSTLMAEFNAMRLSSHPWRAYVYAIMTIGISFGLGTLIYSVPVWTKGYN